jgi:TolB-like protein/Tfp pilus assembly protein PilF
MGVELEEYPAAEVAAQLSRILATDAFRRSPSLGRFLAYLVERSIAGERESIKEYRLGVDVFDRGQDFDPRDDTIVRVQARNLRARLDEYYQHSTAADTIRFVLSKGAYALRFQPFEMPAAVLSEPTAVEAIAEPDPPIQRKPAYRRTAIAAAVLLAISAAGAFAFWASRHSAPSRPGAASDGTTVLVAPFTNLSADKDNEYFAGGLTEELIDALANLPGLRVVARTSSPRWKDKELDFGNLRQLGIENVVEGSVRKEGTRVRISVRLIEASNGRHLWSHEYDREIQDSIVTEQEIANAVAAALKVRFAPAAAPSIRPPNPEAYELYLKGRYSWHQYNAASAEKGIAYLERSLSLDPSFAPAYVALAGCYGTQVIYYRISPAAGYTKMHEMALKALHLDDTQAEAHTLLAGAYAWNDWNWDRAELEYRGALQLAPQSVIAHQYYASFLGAIGRPAEAEAQMREAMRLDPLDSLLQWGEAQLMYWRGENLEAEAMLNKIVKQDPEFGLTAQLLAEVEWALGKDGEAEAVLLAHLSRRPMDPIPLGELGYTLAKTGRAGEAGDIMKRLEQQALQSVVPQQALAFIYLGLGNHDKAIDELWKASDARSIRVPWFRVDPVYTPLRSNPRWADLLRHVNLQ